MERNNLDFILNGIPRFCEEATPVAKRCGISSLEALALIILAEHTDLISFYFPLIESSLKSLIVKGCVIFKDEKYSLTSKGAIIEKSLNSVKEKF